MIDYEGDEMMGCDCCGERTQHVFIRDYQDLIEGERYTVLIWECRECGCHTETYDEPEG